MVAAVPMAGAWGQAQDGFWGGVGGGPGAEQPPPQRGTGPSVEPGGSRCAAVPGPRAAACRRRPGSFARGFSTPVHSAI